MGTERQWMSVPYLGWSYQETSQCEPGAAGGHFCHHENKRLTIKIAMLKETEAQILVKVTVPRNPTTTELFQLRESVKSFSRPKPVSSRFSWRHHTADLLICVNDSPKIPYPSTQSHHSMVTTADLLTVCRIFLCVFFYIIEIPYIINVLFPQ